MKRSVALFILTGLLIFGGSVTANATMLFTDNDYTCGWENYATAVTNTNSFEIGMNLAVYASGSTTDISFAQLNYGGGDWNTDTPADILNLQSYIQGQLPTATVTTGYATFATLANYDLIIMAGHNAFTIDAANTALLKSWIDGGGVLFVDDCNNTAASPFLASFNTLIFNMYGISNAGMTALAANHLLYSSYYALDGSNFSYTAAGNGTEWNQNPIRGYENHPNQINPVPEPATMLLIGSGLLGLAGFRKKIR